jgi:SAM-dependent methyltransferase
MSATAHIMANRCRPYTVDRRRGVAASPVCQAQGVDLNTVAWLGGPQGTHVLAVATTHDAAAHARSARGVAGAVDPLRAVSTLRAQFPEVDPALVSAALTQVRLRRRGRPRLGPDVAHLLLTQDGLEQATRPQVAALRADRYVAADAHHVADLGCGVGLDTIAFARAGLRVSAVERDPVVAALAAANARALGVADLVDVRVGDLTDRALLDKVLAVADAAFVDPARRDPGAGRDGRSARITDPASWSPPWPWVRELATRVPRTAAKVAPGVPHDLTPSGGCITWTSDDGQLLEAEIAWPALAIGDTRRRAIVVRGGHETVLESSIDLDDEPAPPVGAIGAWLHEPDDAVIRAGLVAEVAHRCAGRLLDERVAYVTTDLDVDLAPLSVRFRVLAALPFDVATLRAELSTRGVGHVVVKKRAIAADPDDVRRALALPKAAGSAVVMLTRVGAQPWAFVCEPTVPAPPVTPMTSATPPASR